MLNALFSGDWILANTTCFLFFHVIWGLEDKKDIQKLSNVFTFWGSSLMTVTSVYYIATEQPEVAILCHSIFYNHMLFELLYGVLYFPKYMHGLTTYTHHIVYLLFEYILIWETSHLYIFVYYFPQEFPTFLLTGKRYFEIDSDFYNLILLVSFIFFRFFYYFAVSYHYRNLFFENDLWENSFFVSMFLMVGVLQSKWCLDLLLKTLQVSAIKSKPTTDEQIEKVKTTEKWFSNVLYVIKGGIIFVVCLCVSKLVISSFST